jgi:hypothetical protein
MAAGLGLAFPGGIGSRSGNGTGVAPILVTPARSTGQAPAKTVSQATLSGSRTPAEVSPSAPASTGSTVTTAPPPATTITTLPPDVVGQVNQTVSDVLGNLIPQSAGSR